MYLWERPDWPAMTWDNGRLVTQLSQASRAQGHIIGKMEDLGFNLRREAHLNTLTEDVIRTSEIEGEKLDNEAVRSSLALRLGMDIGALAPADRNVDGVVEMMLDATSRYAEPLTAERMFGWHAALFPTGHSGLHKIRVGEWRDDATGPMQVVSGPVGHRKMHYEAPPAAIVAAEMDRFLAWFAAPGPIDPLLTAGIAHLWFVTIHPFDDGNGRIARAIGDLALARSEQSPQRFYSMSAQIRRERDMYYLQLERAQELGLDITDWLDWFLACLHRAMRGSGETLARVLAKARFWSRYAQVSLNERQVKVLNRLLDGFEGKLTSTKWAKLAKCSQDTAYRDIQDLIERGALYKETGGGRSTSYAVASHATRDADN